MAESNRMFDLVTPALTEMQSIETMLNSLREELSIDDAVGSQLDGIGDIVDLPRGTMTDDEVYRAALRVKNSLNQSCGQPEQLILYLNQQIGIDHEYREPQPGDVAIHITDLVDFVTVLDGLKRLKPAGVQVYLIYHPAADPAFNTADEDGHGSPGYGFLELDYPESEGYTAGVLTELII